MTRIEPTVLSWEAKNGLNHGRVLPARFEPTLLSSPVIERRSIMTFWAEDSHPRIELLSHSTSSAGRFVPDDSNLG